jgi:restriction endonuclease S subunit
MSKEAKARILINDLLRRARWRFFDEETGPANIALELHVKVKKHALECLGDDFENTASGFVDYLLLDERGFPVAVLEAKSEKFDPLVGKEQARKYARSLNVRFVLLSNGNIHYFWDLEQGNPVLITELPTLESLGHFQTFQPNPVSLINQVVAADYVAVTQDPNYAADPRWQHDAQRDAYIKDTELKFLRPYQVRAIEAKGAIASGLCNGIGFGSTEFIVVRPDRERLLPEMVYLFLSSRQFRHRGKKQMTGSAGQQRVPISFVENLEIPVPPLEVQEKIVAELDGYRRVIEGARQVIENYQPVIPVGSDWPKTPLGSVAAVDGQLVDPRVPEYSKLPHVSAEDIEPGNGRLLELNTAAEDRQRSNKYLFNPDCVLYSKIRPYLRKAAVACFRGLCSADMYPIRPHAERLDVEFLLWVLLSREFTAYADDLSHRARMPKLNREQLFAYEIPLPPLNFQRQILAEITAERALVESNRKLIEIFERKIQAKLAELWGHG